MELNKYYFLSMVLKRFKKIAQMTEPYASK